MKTRVNRYHIRQALILAAGIWPFFAFTANAGPAAKSAPHYAAHAAKHGVQQKTKEDQAIDLVFKQPEVKAWLKQFPGGKSKLGGAAAFTADHDGGDMYSVHVYEDLPDHTATFNWYDVNIKTGKSTKKF